jgi:hypothetical protein
VIWGRNLNTGPVPLGGGLTGALGVTNRRPVVIYGQYRGVGKAGTLSLITSIITSWLVIYEYTVFEWSTKLQFTREMTPTYIEPSLPGVPSDPWAPSRDLGQGTSLFLTSDCRSPTCSLIFVITFSRKMQHVGHAFAMSRIKAETFVAALRILLCHDIASSQYHTSANFFGCMRSVKEGDLTPIVWIDERW